MSDSIFYPLQNKSLPAEKQMISAMPDIKKLTLTAEDEFMVLACDGIWNYMSSEEVVNFVRTKLTEKPEIKLTQICEEVRRWGNLSKE